MLAIHPNARTTPAVRAEIAQSRERSSVLAGRYGVSAETIRKWRKRGPTDCQDRSARPHKLPWRATDEERAIVCALRRATGFPLDDLTFVVSHFLPHLNRDAVYRILRAEGLNRLPPSEQTRKPHGTFKDYQVGFVHVDVKHLPKLRDRDGSLRKRYLYVAIDRASRFVHLAVKDDETTASAVAFLKEALAAFPFRVTHVLTDRGSCFTADAFERACAAPNKLAPYLDYLGERVAAFPDLSAVRLTRELRERGYVGAYTAVKRFVAAIRPNDGPKPFEVRFETPAGHQAQVDFARFVVTFEDEPGVTRIVWLFSLVLGHSRHIVARFVLHQDLQTLLRCHMAAFEAIGGVPIEILSDRMKTAVTGQDDEGHIVYNRSLIALAKHFGFLPRACRPYRAKTKGKVERPFS